MRNLVDTLESRQLLAATPNFTVIDGGTSLPVSVVSTYKISKTGTLFLSGTSKADKLNVVVKNGKLVAGTNTLALALHDDTRDEIRARIGPTGSRPIKRIDITGLGGNDVIYVNADVPVSVRGSAGNDRIDVFAPKRTIVGGSGSNTIHEGTEKEGFIRIDKPSKAVQFVGSLEFNDFILEESKPIKRR